MKESLIRELIRLQDLLDEYVTDKELWQRWALANEEIIYYLEEEDN